MNFLTTAEIIKQARARGFNFGKGDPMNRLRYYIKLGLIPHMERRQAKPGDSFTQGFMPESTIDLLLNIQNHVKEPVTYREPTIVSFPKVEKVETVTPPLKTPKLKLALAFIPALALFALAGGLLIFNKTKVEEVGREFSGVLAASTIPGNLEINADTIINGRILANNLDQDLNQTSSPTFKNLTLSEGKFVLEDADKWVQEKYGLNKSTTIRIK